MARGFPGPHLASRVGTETVPWHKATLHVAAQGIPAHLLGGSAHAMGISFESDQNLRQHFLSQYHWQVAGEPFKDRSSHH